MNMLNNNGVCDVETRDSPEVETSKAQILMCVCVCRLRIYSVWGFVLILGFAHIHV